ncbi:MAG TPA: hypothetical protein VLA42_18195 [Verrucomicrobiae bacterium]|jgi:predicted DNA-binding transcriptional regulator AlpA|nr:hypothetical protein [Verrucomicrobiae bacterium]
MTNPEVQQATQSLITPADILTPQQLADRLQVKRSWIFERTRNRADIRNSDPFPFFKLGLYLRFSWADVCAWIERQKSDYKRPKTH